MANAGSLHSGTRLGRYEILSLLAAGGMGEVYVARDTNLGRRVALKVLPSELTADADRTARFIREAEASSALNHPAIVTVHDAGAAGDVQYLAMELIDGEPLSEWMRSHRDTPRALELMAQVAEGLAAAHAHGIVHRDLKPANIVVGKGGWAKVVDFGIAKLTERTNGKSNGSGETAPAAVMGTAAYMAPEQIEGRAVDHRADVYSFGVVLHELVTGRHPIDNVTARPLDRLPRDLQKIIRRCLAKDPEQRYQSMKDLALDLREVSFGDAPVRRRSRWMWAAAAMVIIAIAAGIAYWKLAPPPAGDQTLMTRMTNSGKIASAAISPDGKYLVHAVREGDQQALWVKQVATGTLTRIAEPQPRYYFGLTVSHDGNWVFYGSATRAEPNVVDLFQMPLLGGTPRRIATDIEFAFTVAPDGQRVAFRRFNAFDREHRLTVATVDTGEEEVVLRRSPPQFIDEPSWSPDGKTIAFAGKEAGKNGLYLFDVATRSITAMKVPAWAGVGSMQWLPDGSGMLITVFDRESPAQIWLLKLDGAASKITSDINAYSDVSVTADMSAIAAVRDETDSNIWTLDVRENARPGTAALRPVTTGLGNFYGGGGVAWISESEVLYSAITNKMPTFYATAADGSGQPRRVVHGMPAWAPVLSPDGRKFAYVSDKSGTQEVWISDVDGQNARQVSIAGRVAMPSFTPDGQSIVFVTGGEKQAAWIVDVDGGPARQLTETPTSRALVSPDGKWLLCRLRSTEPDVPLWRTALVPISGNGAPRFFPVPAYGGQILLAWHPDGKAFSFIDAKDGIANVWLQDVEGGAPRQITFFESGEIFAFGWSRDGRKLVFSRGEPTSDAVMIRNFR